MCIRFLSDWVLTTFVIVMVQGINSAWSNEQPHMSYSEDNSSHKRQRLDRGPNAVTTGPYVNDHAAAPTTAYDPVRDISPWTIGETYPSYQLDIPLVQTSWEILPNTQTSLSTHASHLEENVESLQFDFADRFANENLEWVSDPAFIQTFSNGQTNQNHETAGISYDSAPLDESVCCFGMVRIYLRWMHSTCS